MSRLIMNHFKGCCKADVEHVERLMKKLEIEKDVLKGALSLRQVIYNVYVEALNLKIPAVKIHNFMEEGHIEIDINLQDSSLTMWGEKVETLEEIEEAYYLHEKLDIEYIRFEDIYPMLKEGSKEIDWTKTSENSFWAILKPKSLQELKDAINDFMSYLDDQRKFSKTALRNHESVIVKNKFEPFHLMTVKTDNYSEFERIDCFTWLDDFGKVIRTVEQ